MSKRTPLTTAQKQGRRRNDLHEIARSAGWASWDDYSTAVRRGAVKISSIPKDWVSIQRKPPVKRAA